MAAQRTSLSLTPGQRISLKLTPEQQATLRKVTGKDADSLELGAEQVEDRITPLIIVVC